MTALGGFRAFQQICTALEEMSPEHQAELAYDLATRKGEPELVARITHELRRRGVPVWRERRRVDLSVEVPLGSDRMDEVGVEFKICHLLNASRHLAPSGFEVFASPKPKVNDLAKLRSGQASLLVGAVPLLLDRAHAQYPTRIGPAEIKRYAPGESWTGVIQVAAEDFAHRHDIFLCQRSELWLSEGEVGRVVLAMWAFVSHHDEGM